MKKRAEPKKVKNKATMAYDINFNIYAIFLGIRLSKRKFWEYYIMLVKITQAPNYIVLRVILIF